MVRRGGGSTSRGRAGAEALAPPAHPHACFFYHDPDEAVVAAATHFRSALARGERCVYVHADNERDAVVRGLAAAGIDVAAEEARGALSILGPDDYAPAGIADLERLDTRVTELARPNGFNGTAFATEMMWAARAGLSGEQLLALEERYGRTIEEGGSLSSLCMCSLTTSSAAVIEGVLQLHAWVFVSDLLIENPFHEPPVPGSPADRQLVRLAFRLERIRRLREDRERGATGEWLEALIQASPVPVIALEPDGKVLLWSPAAEALFGWSAAEVLGRQVPIVAQDQQAEFRSILDRVLREGGVTGLELVRYRRDGSPVRVSVSAATIRDANGQISGIMGVIQDISERARIAERERFLAHAGQVLGSSLDHAEMVERVAHLAVPGLADWCVVDLVDELEERPPAGVAAARAEHHAAIRELQRRYPHGLGPPGHPLRRTLRAGQPVLVRRVTPDTLAQIAQDADHLELLRALELRSAILVPLTARARTIGAVTLAATTTSGRAYSEDDLELAIELGRRAALAIDNARLYRDARRAVRIRNDVLRVVAHDLRNPLNTIGLAAGFLLEMLPLEDGSRTIRRQIEIIRKSAARANALIGDLLDVARLETGNLALRTEPLDPAPLIDEALDLLRTQAAERKQHLETDLRSPLPPIRADRHRILQALTNLIGNAIKFTPEGGRITVRAETAPGAVRFAVIDTGPGIAPADIPHLFDAFWQARKGAGSGLGLAIVKGVIDAHGGRITVESQLGHGTTFRFDIPTAPQS